MGPVLDLQSDRQTICHLHERWLDINRTWSTDGFDDLLTPDFICFVGNGSVFRGRDAAVEEWAILGLEVEVGADWELDVFDRTIDVEGNAGWLTYEFHLRGVYDSEPFDQRGRGTEIYRRGVDGWRMAVGHWSWRQ